MILPILPFTTREKKSPFHIPAVVFPNRLLVCPAELAAPKGDNPTLVEAVLPNRPPVAGLEVLRDPNKDPVVPTPEDVAVDPNITDSSKILISKNLTLILSHIYYSAHGL